MKPINLNKARKARAKADARTKADENAVVFGLPKSAKQLARLKTAKAKCDLDGKKTKT